MREYIVRNYAVCSFFLLLSCINSIYQGFDDELYNRKAILDRKGNVLLLWRYDDVNITFQIQVKAKGWIGFGFSPNGGMKNADIVIFYIDRQGKPFLKDMFSDDYTMPLADNEQDVTYISSMQNDTHLGFSFTRKRSTCNEDDLALTEDTVQAIYAVSDFVPQRLFELKKHETSGSKTLRLFDAPFDEKPLDENKKVLEITAKNITIPVDTDTFYWCEIVELPKWKEHFMFRYEPIVEENNEDLVHHVHLYGCGPNDSKFLKSEQCFHNYFEDVSLSVTVCNQLLLRSAIGLTEPITFPNETGLRMFQSTGFTHVLLQLHYNNPNLLKNRTDNSGFRLYFTPTQPTYFVQRMTFFVPHGSAFLILPPKQKTFTQFVYCNAKCTEYFPKEGLTIFSGEFHGHEIVTRFHLRHIRNGKKLDDVISDNYFDPYHQISIKKQEFTLILPKDEFILECTFDTSNRNLTVFGGPYIANEMCMAFLLGYSKETLIYPFTCNSFLSFETEWSIFNATYSQSINAFEVNNKLMLPNEFALTQLQYIDQELAEIYQTVVQYGRHIVRCPLYNSNNELELDGNMDQEGPPYINSTVLTEDSKNCETVS